MKKKVFFALSVLFMLLIGTYTVSAAKIEYLTEGKTYSKFDITNDGKADKIKIKKTLYNDYDPAPGRYDIYVNGKNVYSVAAKYAGRGEGHLINISSKKHFLALQLLHPYSDATYSYKLLYFSGGKLKVVADLHSKLMKTGSKVDYIEPRSVSSKAVKFNALTTVGGIGHTQSCVTYNVLGSKLALKSNVLPIKYEEEFDENIWYANRNLTLYKKANSTQKSGTVKNGSRCKVTSIYFGKTVWFKVASGSKSGWVKAPDPYSGTKYFYEAQM